MHVLILPNRLHLSIHNTDGIAHLDHDPLVALHWPKFIPLVAVDLTLTQLYHRLLSLVVARVRYCFVGKLGEEHQLVPLSHHPASNIVLHFNHQIYRSEQPLAAELPWSLYYRSAVAVIISRDNLVFLFACHNRFVIHFVKFCFIYCS